MTEGMWTTHAHAQGVLCASSPDLLCHTAGFSLSLSPFPQVLRDTYLRFCLRMDAAERIEAASKFLLQSPPGEINDVLNGNSEGP